VRRQSEAATALWMVHCHQAIQSGVALRLPTALQNDLLKFKIPSPSAARSRQVATGSLKFPGRPEHLSRAFKSGKTFRQVSWLYHRFRPAMTFTVARPRGIHTRFPILLAFMRGTRTRYQKSSNAADNSTGLALMSTKMRSAPFACAACVK
jgi:hypothetical protein